MPGECIAELQHLPTHCKFGAYLSEALSDRLACGLQSESTQKRLLSEANLSLSKAIEISLSTEAAEKNTQQLKVLSSCVWVRLPKPVGLSRPVTVVAVRNTKSVIAATEKQCATTAHKKEHANHLTSNHPAEAMGGGRAWE